MTQFSNQQKAKCAAREAAMRRNVYPRFVKKGTMKQDAADYELAVMSEIASDYSQVSDVGSFEALQSAALSMTPEEQRALMTRLLMLIRDLVVSSSVDKVNAGFDAAAPAP